MSEFINKYPLFSYISVPLLLIVFVVLITLAIKPKSTVKDYFSRLYQSMLFVTEFLNEPIVFDMGRLKALEGLLTKAKHYYEMLESEELYEVESVINNLEKALGISRALIALKSSEDEILGYIGKIKGELSEAQKVLNGFLLSRGEEYDIEFPPSALPTQKSRKKAQEYLSHIKK